LEHGLNRFFTLRRVGLMSLSGVLGALAFPLALPVGPRREVDPGGWLEPLAFVCLVPVLAAARGLRPGKTFVSGFLAGVVFFTCLIWWITIAMATFGGMPLWLSTIALELLVAWCAFHWGLALGLARFFSERNGWPVGLTLPPIWMATELLRNYFCSGFPWGNLGYSQARHLWFSQIASAVGVYGGAFVIAWVNGAIYETLRAWLWKERSFPLALAVSALAAFVVANAYGAVRIVSWKEKLKNAPKVRVAVVQGNIDQKLKNEQGIWWRTVLERYNPPTLEADAAGADLIVWPEASFPLPVTDGTTSIDEKGLSKSVYHAQLLLGVDIVLESHHRKALSENAALLLSQELRVRHKYIKHHLVPFGEYVPLKLDEWLPIRNLAPGTFVHGEELKPAALTKETQRTATLGIEICFDAVFPEISRAYARQDVDILLNITNDAWYGFSSAPFQFLRMVQMRSIETGRPVARAANTGISAFIDPIGQITQATQLGIVQSDAASVTSAELSPPEWRIDDLPLVSDRTLYTAIGDIPSYAASLFCLCALLYGIIKPGSANRQRTR
jgi:apolipoprotein N-acyltransferase